MTDSNHNYWQDDDCARAFWDQHRALPYQELLRDTAALLKPEAGERWLDLGCGAGHLAAAVWRESRGRVEKVVCMDYAPLNAEAIAKLRARLQPSPNEAQMPFIAHSFSDGLPQLETASFDGIVSGLAISYAESRDPATGQYTDYAYNRLLAEMLRVLKPGGRLIFSVNVPHPNFWSILWKSLKLAFRVSKPFRVLKNALRMQRYGRWLKAESQRGRFHFYPLPEILFRLGHAGFVGFESRLSYADQAYVICAEKSAQAVGQAA